MWTTFSGAWAGWAQSWQSRLGIDFDRVNDVAGNGFKRIPGE